MIRITLTSGLMAGESRSSDQIPADVTPEALLSDLVQKGWDWSIDWSRATPEEKLLWGKHDFAARVVRALLEGRSVRFLGQVYGPAATTGEVAALAGAVEDAVVGSGRNVTILRDDVTGLVIGVRGYEQP